MPTWNLRLVACAGFVALLSRLPALDSAADVVAAVAVAGALALGVHLGPLALRALRGRLRLTLPHPAALRPRLHPAHGADA